jgi:hypothetical protein
MLKQYHEDRDANYVHHTSGEQGIVWCIYGQFFAL